MCISTECQMCLAYHRFDFLLVSINLSNVPPQGGVVPAAHAHSWPPISVRGPHEKILSTDPRYPIINPA